LVSLFWVSAPVPPLDDEPPVLPVDEDVIVEVVVVVAVVVD
jgi:hypothetical protein